MPVFWDTETCGFHGMPVLLQHAVDEEPAQIMDLWRVPARDSLKLIDDLVAHPDGNVLFNAAFDLFHVIKWHTTLTTLRDAMGDDDFLPMDYLDAMGMAEEQARFAPYTLKFHKLVDLMIVAQRGEYQTMMNRKDIRIRRIPTLLAPNVAAFLEKEIIMSPALFARFKNKTKRWSVQMDEDDPDFADVVCAFAPSKALKVIAVDAGLVPADEVVKFESLHFESAKPIEYGYAPYAKAGVLNKKGVKLDTGPGNWRGTWPDVISQHIASWHYDKVMRQYAFDDPVYTRGVYHHLGEPEMNDTNSVLCNQVAACRWAGFGVDVDKLKQLREGALLRSKSAPTAPNAVKTYVYELLTDTEKAITEGSTKKVVLEQIATWDTPAAERAKEVISARTAQKEMELYDKLIFAGRFHASFKVLGTLSDRMAGADGLNAQGIKAVKAVREAFVLADRGLVQCGGDFDAFEVSIAEAVYGDETLRDHLTNGVECPHCYALEPDCPHCKGTGKLKVKIHALFAKALYPHLSIAEIEASKGQEKDYYTDGKKGIFLMFYGGDENTMEDRMGIPEDVAIAAVERFRSTYRGIAAFQDRIKSDFCSMTQPGGIGSRVVWQDPKPFAESIFGFRRYFTLENQITKALFKLAEDPPKAWLDVKVKVVRRDRVQTAGNAVRSALFAAAFNVQGKCLRAAANHFIQSPGADITKEFQRDLWELQPDGVHPWKIKLLNVHDEVNACVVPELVGTTSRKAVEIVERFRPKIPLIKLSWSTGMKNWGEK